jgi:glycosyltransferase involved in cell wall biosynthesis
MTRRPRIIYVRPAKGGIKDYSDQILTIYRQQGYQPVVVTITKQPTAEQRSQLTQPAELIHFEVGAGETELLKLSRELLGSHTTRQIITIHDPGVVVFHPVAVVAASSRNSLVRFIGKVVRRLLAQTAGRVLIRRQLQHSLVSTIYLRPDCATAPNAYYLPQPTYHQEPPASMPRPKPLVGFGGYWASQKGLGTLLDAWEQLSGSTKLKLIVGGSTGNPQDPYAVAIRQRVAAIPQSERPELTGFIAAEKLDNFLRSLSALALPYWPEVPNGTSAMAMRAAELGVPLIATTVPSLQQQLGTDGAYYVEPKNASALAKAIQELNDNPEPFQLRARAAQQRIFASHSWIVVGKRLNEVIESVFKDNS